MLYEVITDPELGPHAVMIGRRGEDLQRRRCKIGKQRLQALLLVGQLRIVIVGVPCLLAHVIPRKLTLEGRKV